MFRVFALVLATLFGFSVDAADESNSLGISLYGSFLHTERVPNALFFFSDIEENDSFELRKAIRNHDIDTVVLSSRGGSVWEGLNMAGIIFDKGLKTYVPQQGLGEEGNCASACSFMFFGGSTRVADGKLGVHQFYSGAAKESAQIGKTQSNAQFTVSEIIGFLNEFETPPFVFERMFQQKEMYYFNQNELEEIARASELISSNDIAKIEIFIEELSEDLAKRKGDYEPKVEEPLQPVPSTPETKEVEIELVEPIEVPVQDLKTSESKEKKLIKDIQTELNRLNCSAGKVDGIIGGRTKAALKRYSKVKKLELSETLLADQNFLDELKLSDLNCVAQTPKLFCSNPSYRWAQSFPEVKGLKNITINNFHNRRNGSQHTVKMCTDTECSTYKFRYFDRWFSESDGNKWKIELRMVWPSGRRDLAEILGVGVSWHGFKKGFFGRGANIPTAYFGYKEYCRR